MAFISVCVYICVCQGERDAARGAAGRQNGKATPESAAREGPGATATLRAFAP